MCRYWLANLLHFFQCNSNFHKNTASLSGGRISAYGTLDDRNTAGGDSSRSTHYADTGPKYVWVFLLGPQIVWLLTDGFHYLTNPFTFGYGFQTGWAYVITAFVQIAILIILLLKTQTFLELVSDTKRYELQMALPFRKPKIRGAIEEVFDLPAVTQEQKKFNQFNLENIASIPPGN